MSLPAVVNPHVQAMVTRATEMERRAKILCRAGGDRPDVPVIVMHPAEHRGRLVPVWRLFVQQAYGLETMKGRAG